MDVDRGDLARIDRKLLACLGRDETYRMVRVPVSPAKWSTWRRYCDSASISMGRAIAALIDRDLARVAEAVGDDYPVLAERVREQRAKREAELASREQAVSAAEGKHRRRSERLRVSEAELQTLAQRVQVASNLTAHGDHNIPKVGRNDRCPCGSGLKYKYCPGLPGRLPNVVSR